MSEKKEDLSFHISKDNLGNYYQAQDAASQVPFLIAKGFDDSLYRFLCAMLYNSYGYMPSPIDKRTKEGKCLTAATTEFLQAAQEFDRARKAYHNKGK